MKYLGKIEDAKDLVTKEYIEDYIDQSTIEGIQLDGIDVTPINKKVNIPVFTGASGSADGGVGLVPQPLKPSQPTDGIQLLTSQNGWQTAILSTQVYTSGPSNGKRSIELYFRNNGSVNVNHTLTAIIPDATTSETGFMSATDKTKLDKLVFDSGNKIDSSILPSYVDDVIEAYARSGQTALSSTWLATESATGTVITPEAGKIYVLMADSGDYSANTQFRWGGTAYVKMNDGGVSAITNDEINAICV